jgi:hypothetical protein
MGLITSARKRGVAFRAVDAGDEGWHFADREA